MGTRLELEEFMGLAFFDDYRYFSSKNTCSFKHVQMNSRCDSKVIRAPLAIDAAAFKVDVPPCPLKSLLPLQHG
jgi:hypothetical protein